MTHRSTRLYGRNETEPLKVEESLEQLHTQQLRQKKPSAARHVGGWP